MMTTNPFSASVSFRVQAGACGPHLKPAGALPRPLAPLEVAQLCQLFAMFDGAIPRRELIAEGFDVADLVARGAVMPPKSHLDFDFYFVGETLRKAVQTV